MTFIYIVLAIMVACNTAICIWFMIRSAQWDRKYQQDLDRIYGRKIKEINATH